MEYEKNEKNSLISFFSLSIKKYYDFSEKKFRLSRAVAVTEICLDTSSVPMKARKLKFWLT
jgi:hypothetical protein